MTIKSFRGKIQDGGQDQIYLHGGDPAQGYMIAKFQAVGVTLASQAYEALLQIFKVPQTSASASIDFTDQTLLGIAYWGSHGGISPLQGYVQNVIFDNEIFNQDIYITCKDSDAQPCNYYLELKQVTMPGPEQAVVNFNAALLHGD